MKKHIVTYFSFSIILIFLFSSCELITSLFTPEKEDEEIGEFEDVNIFDRNLLPDDNSFIVSFSITGKEEYLYAVTDGKTSTPGKIVKISKDGEEVLIKNLLQEAKAIGYTESHANECISIDSYNNNLLVEAVPNTLQFEHGEIELYCLKPEDLSVQWRWIPNENGSLDIFQTGRRNITFWNCFYIILYASEIKDDGFFIVFLDTDGHEILKRFIESSCPTEDGDICIVDDKLLLHQTSEPLIIYDLNKLINPDYDFKDCIDFSFSGEANIYSNIVSDGNVCYFCSWEKTKDEGSDKKLMVYAMSLVDYKTLWSYEMPDDNFSCVNSILLDRGKLFLAADYGCVYCLNAKNGRLNWKTTITDVDHPKNLLCEGCIVKDYYVIPCASNGYLYYFDIKTGAIKGKHYIPVFGGKRHCYVEDDYVYITTGSYISRLRLKEK